MLPASPRNYWHEKWGVENLYSPRGRRERLIAYVASNKQDGVRKRDGSWPSRSCCRLTQITARDLLNVSYDGCNRSVNIDSKPLANWKAEPLLSSKNTFTGVYIFAAAQIAPKFNRNAPFVSAAICGAQTSGATEWGCILADLKD